MITLGFSPCPNDTFIFDALVHQKIDTEGLSFDVRIEDVETLNQLAMRDELDMAKVSYHAFLYLSDRYTMLDSGGALGFGVGPLLVSRKHFILEDLTNLTVAIPGEYTTAHLLLKLAAPMVKQKKVFVFHEIEDAIISGSVDAGVIIHESRFTYEKKGLLKILDLGEYWESLTQSPIPLGGIAVKSNLGNVLITKLNRVMRSSVVYAKEHPDDVMDFVRCNAQEMDEEVMKKHIGLYVNQFTVGLGEEGNEAVRKLVRLFRKQNI